MKAKQVKGIFGGAAPNMVGNGFRVSNYFPHGNPWVREMSPFYLLDYNAPISFGVSDQPRGVGVHPHRGFETVTIVYEGELAHKDSSGSAGTLSPGDVQWMTAGSGVVHEEFHTPGFSRSGGTLHMIQLWVNLPAKDKMTHPRYQDIRDADIPRIGADHGNGYLRIIAGETHGRTGAAMTFTPIHLFDLRMDKDAEITVDIPAGFNTGVLVLAGGFQVNGSTIVKAADFVLFGHEGESIRMSSTEDQSIALLLSGQPILEPVVAYGPFLMNTQDEIHQAFADFHSGKFGKL
jgi:redox-sensitive bicupin YhaK (pirin superfamily)